MGGRIRYTEEFKLGVVAQVTSKGHSVTSITGRLGVSTKSLYDWVKYAFIKAHQDEFSVRAMCRVLKVHASGFYAWLKNGLCGQAKRRRHLTGLIKQSWLESGCVYGYRKIHYSRKVVGWSMHSRMQTSLALNAQLMAVWRRKPTDKVIVHSDQGSQFTSQEWREFLTDHNLEASMSRRGNCYDNAVAESFFHLLKTERIRRKTYKTRAEAVRTCSITSKYSTIQNVGMLITGCCHPLNLRWQQSEVTRCLQS